MFSILKSYFANRRSQASQKKVSRKTDLHVERLEDRHLMATVTVDFSDLSLAANSYWNGPDPFGVDVADPFGGALPVRKGSFKSAGTSFANSFNNNFNTWNDFAYSNQTDNTTAGFGNQFSAFAGHGFNDANYALTSGYLDQAGFDPTDASQLAELPNFTLPGDATIANMHVTNTTYAALSMKLGDNFAKKFGGASGNEADWFKLTAYGTDAAGSVLANTAEIYLADYRFSDNKQDFILQDWTSFNLSALAGAKRLYFNLSSSDVGTFGMNTPSSFAVDNITLNDPTPNRAPVLNTALTPTLGTIVEDTTNPAGTSIQTLLTNAITDKDTSDVRGIAITGAGGAANGTWQVSLDSGTSWKPLGTPSNASALLLPAGPQSQVRFIPKTNFSGSVSLYYRAWDQTQGTPGGTLNLVGAGKTGGGSAFSSGVEQAPLTITPVNDAPVLSGIAGARSYKNNGVPVYIATIGTTNTPSASVADDNLNLNGGKLSVTISSGADASNRISIASALFAIDANRQVIRKDAVNGDKVIGTLNLNGGVGTTRYEVTFNANAITLIAQQLVRAVTFSTLNGTSTTQRTIDFTLSDGSLNGLSNKLSKIVNVI